MESREQKPPPPAAPRTEPPRASTDSATKRQSWDCAIPHSHSFRTRIRADIRGRHRWVAPIRSECRCGELVSGLSRDDDMIVTEGGLGRARFEKSQRAVVVRQFGEREGILGRVELRLEVVNAKFVEVAEDDVARAIRHETYPVVERLSVVFLEVLAAFLHLDEHDRFPNVIHEGRSAAILTGFADTELGLSTAIEGAF